MTTSASPAQKHVGTPHSKSTPGLLHHIDDSLHGNPSHSVLHGASFRTKFHGGTFLGTLARCIPGMSDFTSDAFAAFPVLDEVRLAVTRSQTALFAAGHSRTGHEDLIALFVDKDKADEDIHQYMSEHDHVYHIIHGPTFERDYAQMWLDLATADTRQVVLALLMVAIVRLTNLPSSGGAGSWEQAMKIIDMCSDWQQGREIKYDSALDFQTTFLVLLARQLSGRFYKRTWVKAGEMIRIWMCAGLHRRIDGLQSRPTVLTREMRARLWTAAAEFELQAAFEHGMSAHTWPEQTDVAAPLNVLDSALEQDSPLEEIPDHTATSYLAISSKTLRLRHHLNDILNGPDTPLTMQQVNTYVEEVHRSVDALDHEDSSQAIVTRALLSITLFQYILALLVRQLQTSPLALEQQAYRCALVSTASRMLQSHKAAIGQQSHIVEALYKDHIRIALSVCYSFLSSSPRPDCIISNSLETHAMSILQTTATLLANKVKHYQGNRHHYWLTAAALGLIQTRKDPARKVFYLEEAVRLFTEPYADVLSDLQADAQLQEGAVASQEPAQPLAMGLPLQLDFSIDEWFAEWCSDMDSWSAGA
ncbi:transcriptional regulatory protein [Stagonosporopsis vannaccii]|nr:transcriptional regulatory protein [Stagonosporopsis vannaccii]